MSVVVAAALGMLAACSAHPAAGSSFPLTAVTSPSETSPPANGPGWMMTRTALAQVLADPMLSSRLPDTRIYELLQPGQQPVPGIAARLVLTFSSVSSLDSAVNSGDVPTGTYGVLYDPEAWSFTPAAEQVDPVAAATRAASTAHSHGLKFFVAPALNLTTVLAGAASAPRWQQFLDLRLAASMAKVADVVELQAQSLERDTTTYRTFVKAAATQVRQANARAIVFAGLSTNPPGATVTSQHLIDVVQGTQSAVDGYWLNIPAPGPRCPTCNPAQPGIARELLSTVLGQQLQAYLACAHVPAVLPAGVPRDLKQVAVGIGEVP